jgi:signal transduction histidine kinase
MAVGSSDAATILTIGCWAALVLVFGNQSWLDAIIDRFLLRGGHSRRVALERFMRSLSPEIGAVACCQRVVDELVRIFQLRGAVFLFCGGSTVAQAGTIRIEPLLRVWDDGHCIDGLPARPFSLASFRELAPSLQEALVDAEIVGMLPIVSPRRRWGVAFATASPISASMGTADRQEMQNLASQLARILDATELIDRVVTVERSLAHADKLAAIGETAARIAHDIRNPVTAARSLAQQLVRESDATESAEAASLILSELERVEHQVASLLRFARRDEYRFAAVDIGALVRATLESVRGRAIASRVAVHTQIADDVTARVDAEKMRQVLLNLVDNALDALANGADQPRLHVSVSRANAHAHVTIADNGPGAPAAALPHLFEPFFSLKEKGTGLGLAIVKRTVEAHDGRIVVSPAHPGITFDIELPLVDAGAVHASLDRDRFGGAA